MSGSLLRCVLGLLLLSLTPRLAAGRKSALEPVLSEASRLGFYPVDWEPDGSAPMIWGTVNRNPAQFLVDTGFSFLTIDRQVVREVEPLPADAARQMGPLLGPAAGTNWFVIRRLTLSRAEFTGLPARIMDLRLGQEDQVRAQGILGVDFLRRQQAIILCGESRLLLKTHPLTRAAQDNLAGLLRGAGYTEVMMEALSMQAWLVPVHIGEVEFKMVVDTGAARTLLDATFAKELSLKGRGFGLKLSGVENRETKAHRTTVKDFRIGSFSAPDSKMMLGNAGLWNPAKGVQLPPEIASPLRSMQGLLGFDFLRKHSAVIDCQGGKLWLRSPGK